MGDAKQAKITLAQYLLTTLTEECGEVSQAAGKAGRFGFHEIWVSQGATNIERVERELIDISLITIRLRKLGLLKSMKHEQLDEYIAMKEARTDEYIMHARTVGTLMTEEEEQEV